MNSKTKYKDAEPFITKDGSTIRELIHPANTGKGSQSFAEAIVLAGRATTTHFHLLSEEIYHINSGKGKMFLGNDAFDVETGDTILIEPGMEHSIKNTGSCDLKIFCCCYPAYSDEDTHIVD